MAFQVLNTSTELCGLFTTYGTFLIWALSSHVILSFDLSTSKLVNEVQLSKPFFVLENGADMGQTDKQTDMGGQMQCNAYCDLLKRGQIIIHRGLWSCGQHGKLFYIHQMNHINSHNGHTWAVSRRTRSLSCSELLCSSSNSSSNSEILDSIRVFSSGGMLLLHYMKTDLHQIQING